MRLFSFVVIVASYILAMGALCLFLEDDNLGGVILSAVAILLHTLGVGGLRLDTSDDASKPSKVTSLSNPRGDWRTPLDVLPEPPPRIPPQQYTSHPLALPAPNTTSGCSMDTDADGDSP